MKRKNKVKVDFYTMFYLFLFASLVGWIFEGCFSLIVHGTLINHSALVIGPINACYGICACALTYLLYRYKDKSYTKLFLISFFLGSLLEYVMSLGMELVVGFSAWDYSGMFLNINGRVCLAMSIIWGFLGIVWIKFIYPHFENFINKFNRKTGEKLMIGLIIFLIFDAALTGVSILRAREAEKGIPPSNFFESFLDKTFNQKYLQNMFNNKWS